MMPKLVKLLTQISQQLDTGLSTSQQQLTQQQNPEALHDLRVSLRQLRSLLRPLRADLYEARDLDGLVKEMMGSTNRIRDREVLIVELKQQQLFVLADDYQRGLQDAYLHVAEQFELTVIQQRLLSLVQYWQHALSAHTVRQLEKHIRQQWRQQSQKLFKRLQHKQPQKTKDRHRLRILIKQLRYSCETYQKILPKRANAQTLPLKKLQELLGRWHDYSVFLADAEQQTELHVLIPIWQQQLNYWEHKSDQALKRLKRDKKIPHDRLFLLEEKRRASSR